MSLATVPFQEDERAHPAGGRRAYRILLLLDDPRQERCLRSYADALAKPWSAQVAILRNYVRQDTGATCCQVELPMEGGLSTMMPAGDALAGKSLAAGIGGIAASWPFDMLIAEWPESDRDVAAHACVVKDVNVTAVLVRRSDQPLRRVVVPAGGGAHALEGIRVADALANAWSLDARVLRIVQPGKDFWPNRADLKLRCRHIRDAVRLYMDVADVNMPVKVRLGSDVANEIICRSRQGDIIVIGGSSQWLMENNASASIPSRVAAGASGPVVMVLTNRGRPSALTDVFWDRTVQVGLNADGKLSAIEMLVDMLIECRQAPDARRNEIISSVMERERAGVTYIGHETAIPHAALAGFRGLVGMLGVFPEGVPFGKLGEKARFVFLLLTPKESYEVYLPILARIARFMNEPTNRLQLAAARNSAQAVELFARAEGAWRSVGI
jgi:mannitol/fructose-specific phosphotransferase system IIA component (Ntr-type)/nucleotide-binding universal stress UspA family protein